MSFFRRKKFTVNEPDPVFNVVYLGNVITLLARGEKCYEKPLALIWKTYCSKKRPDMPMKLIVTRSGLKAVTKQQGLTEYWVHRTTFCAAPEDYPKIFVWIYKHDGKKMKPELRCHAALCRRAETPAQLTNALQLKISQALNEYRREKISKQNSRISSGSGSLPRRKQILSTGTQNFRPPMARSKSAPKLQAIEECMEEDETVPEEEEDNISIPSSAEFSVHDSPTGGCRQHGFLFDPRHCVLPFSETDPDLSDRITSATSAFSSELDHVSERFADLSCSRRAGSAIELPKNVSPPLVHSLHLHGPTDPLVTPRANRNEMNDEIDRYSDESGYEEKTSLESCDEIPEKILDQSSTTVTCL